MKLLSKSFLSRVAAVWISSALLPILAWSADSRITPGPTLDVRRDTRDPNTLVLHWEGDYILAESSSVGQPSRWRPIREGYTKTRDGANEYRYSTEAGRRFFRLQEPSPEVETEEALTLVRRLNDTRVLDYLDTREVEPDRTVEAFSVNEFVQLAEDNQLTLAKDIIKLPAYSTDWGKLFGVNCYGNQCLDLAAFASSVDAALQGKVTKYGYRIRGGLAAFEKAVGPRRTIADPPASNFSIHDRLNPASVTKTVVAVALLRALEQNGVSIHASIASYLPSYWSKHSSIYGITFQQVLSHTSGFRTSTVGGYTFQHLQNLIAAGVKAEDKIPQYENINYGLARILLCYVDGYNLNWSLIDPLATSIYFVNYLNKELFEPVGIYSVSFTPEPFGNLFYPFPAGNAHGTAYGNWHLREGSAGIQLSVRELSEFLMRMWTPGTYLSQNMLNQLKQYGMGMGDYGDYPDGKAFGKGGYFPASMNGGAELNSAIIHFACGVQAVLVINGPVSAKTVLLNAYAKAWEAK